MCLARLLALPRHWQVWRERVNRNGKDPVLASLQPCEWDEGWAPALGRPWVDMPGGGHEGGNMPGASTTGLWASAFLTIMAKTAFVKCPHMWRVYTCQVLV